jgi:hypothetical protein
MSSLYEGFPTEGEEYAVAVRQDDHYYYCPPDNYDDGYDPDYYEYHYFEGPEHRHSRLYKNYIDKLQQPRTLDWLRAQLDKKDYNKLIESGLYTGHLIILGRGFEEDTKIISGVGMQFLANPAQNKGDSQNVYLEGVYCDVAVPRTIYNGFHLSVDKSIRRQNRAVRKNNRPYDVNKFELDLSVGELLKTISKIASASNHDREELEILTIKSLPLFLGSRVAVLFRDQRTPYYQGPKRIFIDPLYSFGYRFSI